MRDGEARSRSASLLALLVAGACSTDDPSAPSTVPDAGSDASPADAAIPDADLGPTDPVAIAMSPGKDEDPSIVRADDGTLWLAWYSNRDGADRIWLMSSADGLTWGAPRAITDPSEHAFYPSLVQARDGRFHLSWWAGEVGDGGKIVGRIRYASSADTMTWSPPVSLTDAAGLAWGATLAASAVNASELLMVWSSDVAGDKDLYLARSTNGGASWETPVRRVEPAYNDDLPFVAAHGSGSYALVWQRYDVTATSFDAPFGHPSNDIVWSTSLDGITWSELRRVDTRTPSLVPDVFPALHASDDDPTRFGVTWTSVPAGSTKGNVFVNGLGAAGRDPVQVTPDGGYSGRTVRIGIRRHLLVWVKDLDIWARRF